MGRQQKKKTKTKKQSNNKNKTKPKPKPKQKTKTKTETTQSQNENININKKTRKNATRKTRENCTVRNKKQHSQLVGGNDTIALVRRRLLVFLPVWKTKTKTKTYGNGSNMFRSIRPVGIHYKCRDDPSSMQQSGIRSFSQNKPVNSADDNNIPHDKYNNNGSSSSSSEDNPNYNT